LCKNKEEKISSSSICTVDTTWIDILSNAKDIQAFLNVKDALTVDGFKGPNMISQFVVFFIAKH